MYLFIVFIVSIYCIYCIYLCLNYNYYYASFCFRPVPSYYRACVDEPFLKRHALLAPSDYAKKQAVATRSRIHSRVGSKIRFEGEMLERERSAGAGASPAVASRPSTRGMAGASTSAKTRSRSISDVADRPRTTTTVEFDMQSLTQSEESLSLSPDVVFLNFCK